MIHQLTRAAAAGGGRLLLADDSATLVTMLRQGVQGASFSGAAYSLNAARGNGRLGSAGLVLLAVNLSLACAVLLIRRSRRRD